MLFLLNDTVLDVEIANFSAPIDLANFRALSFPDVLRLGAELFARSPLLNRQDPERAGRLALLIAAKQPEVNAALFVAPQRGCHSDQVAANFAQVSIDVMAGLNARHRAGVLTAADVDRQVWRRMAA